MLNLQTVLLHLVNTVLRIEVGASYILGKGFTTNGSPGFVLSFFYLHPPFVLSFFYLHHHPFICVRSFYVGLKKVLCNTYIWKVWSLWTMYYSNVLIGFISHSWCLVVMDTWAMNTFRNFHVHFLKHNRTVHKGFGFIYDLDCVQNLVDTITILLLEKLTTAALRLSSRHCLWVPA